jgi:Plavaka transposase
MGEELPPDTPPSKSDPNPHDWKPFDSRLQFELADFIFRRNQMSAGDINFILGLWAASLAVHNDKPPFSNAKDLYNTIDSTPLGDVPWQTFSLQHNGTKPTSDVPSWMQAEYDVWFRDPKALVQNMLSNPDFKSDFDYAPFQEYTADGTHRFRDFMSGNWAWQQAVSSHFLFIE